MQQGIEHECWSDDEVSHVKEFRLGYEKARGLVPRVIRSRLILHVFLVIAVSAVIAGPIFTWAWSVVGLIVALIGITATHVWALRKFQTSILPVNNLDLMPLSTAELEKLRSMGDAEPRIATAIAGWLDRGNELRRRDLDACEAFFQKTSQDREKQAILTRLGALESKA